MSSELIKVAFITLYDRDPSEYNFSLNYSRRFSSYNANIKYRGQKYHFSLSYEWKDVSSEIVVGLIQYLLLKAFDRTLIPETRMTLNIELYHNFIKNVHKYARKKNIEPELKELFDELNETYFFNNMEISGLQWGSESIRTLGHYKYGEDMITISSVFSPLDENTSPLVKYVLYHEMLHKKHQFSISKTGRSQHHTTDFRKDEKSYPDAQKIEKRISLYLRKKRKSPQRSFLRFTRR